MARGHSGVRSLPLSRGAGGFRARQGMRGLCTSEGERGAGNRVPGRGPGAAAGGRLEADAGPPTPTAVRIEAPGEERGD